MMKWNLPSSGKRVPGAFENCTAILPTGIFPNCSIIFDLPNPGWGERQRVRHNPWKAVHGRLLLSSQAIRRRSALSQQVGWLLIDFGSAQHWCSSIKSYYYNDDVFNFDYGQAKAAVGNYQVQPILKKDFCRREKNQEAEEIFLNITSEKLKSDYAYLSWLARCFIMNGKVGPNGKNVDLKHFLFEGPIGLGALPEDGNIG